MKKKVQANLNKIINILSDGRYHDGTSIGEAVQMTRSAVWKTVKKLISYDIKIDSIKGKGYSLSEPLSLLDLTEIKKHVTNKKIEIELFETINSTNDYLKHSKNVKAPKICLAEQQTQGKGRFNREWYSPFGKNIYLSCVYPFQKDVSELAGLSLMTSLAVMQVLRYFGINDQLFVKWSNDIIFSGKKLSGNLIEVQAETHDACQAIIGIGINVNMLQDDHGKISQEWISMRKILNHMVDRNALAGLLINYLLNYLNKFNDNGFTPFMEEWTQSDCLMNKVITLKNVNEEMVGRVKGITDHGYLLLELGNGQVRAFSSGETTILKNTAI